MASRTKYIVISNKTPEKNWEVALQETTGVCRTCKKAYDIAKFLAGITKPCSSYRKVLETIKLRGAYKLTQKEGIQEAIIIVTQEYI